MNNVVISFLIALIIFSCSQNSNNVESLPTNHEKLLSQDDSLRLTTNLEILDQNWIMDSVHYGVVEKFYWTSIQDTTGKEFFIREYWRSNHNKALFIKLIEKKKDTFFKEKDEYIVYSSDSSSQIVLSHLYEYKTRKSFYRIDTINFTLKKENLKEINQFKSDIDNDSLIKSGWILCGTAYYDKLFKLSTSHRKYRELTKEEFIEILDEIKK